MIRSRLGFLHIGIVILLLAALVPVLATNEARGQAGEEVEIQISGDGFEPAELTIPVGTSVRWVNVDTEPHTLISLDGDFDPVDFEPDDFLSITLEVAGTYAFQLDDDTGPEGTIEVTGGVRDLDQQPAATAAPEATVAPESTVAPDGTPAVPELPDAPEVDTGPALNLDVTETPRLAHIHAGDCESLGIVVYSFDGAQSYLLEPKSEDRGPTELLVGTAGVALEDLFTEPFSIHIHESAANKQNYIGCADIGGRPADPWSPADGLVLEIIEQQDSSLAGTASLRPSADGGTDVSLFLSGPAGIEAATTDPNTTPPTTYTSPTYGYAIAYNNTWEVTQDVSEDGRDLLVLTNGPSFVAFTGAREFNGDPADCVSGFLQERTSDPNAFNVEVAVGPDGEPLVGGTEATGAFAVFNHDYRLASGVVPYTLFVGCIPLIPGEAVLSVVQNVPAAEFEAQIAPREALLRGLVLNQ
jgi:plastocyanin